MLTSAGPSLRPAEETWCVSTKRRVFVHPQNVTPSGTPVALLQPPTPTPTQLLTQQLHPSLSAPNYPTISRPLYAALDTRWMKATSVCGWVAQRPRLLSCWQSHVPVQQVQPKVASRKPLCLCLMFICVFTYLSYLSSTYLLSICLSIVSNIHLFEDQAHVFSLFNNKYIQSNILSESQREDLKI